MNVSVGIGEGFHVLIRATSLKNYTMRHSNRVRKHLADRKVPSPTRYIKRLEHVA